MYVFEAKRIVAVFLAACLALVLLPAMPNQARADTVKTTGTYYTATDTAKMKGNTIVTKSSLQYQKTLKDDSDTVYRTLGRKTRTFKLTSKTRYYGIEWPYEYKMSKSDFKREFKIPRSLGIKVKNGKVIEAYVAP